MSIGSAKIVKPQLKIDRASNIKAHTTAAAFRTTCTRSRIGFWSLIFYVFTERDTAELGEQGMRCEGKLLDVGMCEGVGRMMDERAGA
jgi:hypothetical protein